MFYTPAPSPAPLYFSSPPCFLPSTSVMSRASSQTPWWWAPTSVYETSSRPRLATASAESPSQTTAKWVASWWASSLPETSTSWRRRTTTCRWARWVDSKQMPEVTKNTMMLKLDAVGFGIDEWKTVQQLRIKVRACSILDVWDW